jgi:hypothetical protein
MKLARISENGRFAFITQMKGKLKYKSHAEKDSYIPYTKKIYLHYSWLFQKLYFQKQINFLK